MTKRLTPYGLTDYAQTVSKVGKLKTVRRLAERMPSREIVAKVGVGVGVEKRDAERACKVVRRNGQVNAGS